MSKAAKDGNNFRREWDIEAFEKKAKERLQDRERLKLKVGDLVHLLKIRAPLTSPTNRLHAHLLPKVLL